MTNARPASGGLLRVTGDLLASDCTVIGHQSNCRLGFGRGIAAQIRNQYPGAYAAFAGDPRPAQASPGPARYPVTAKLGNFCYARCGTKLVFNLYGQLDYGAQPGRVYTDYRALAQAVDRMLNTLPELQRLWQLPALKIGLPYLIGCGLAGGDWTEVERLLATAAQQHGVWLHLYEFQPPGPSSKPGGRS